MSSKQNIQSPNLLLFSFMESFFMTFPSLCLMRFYEDFKLRIHFIETDFFVKNILLRFDNGLGKISIPLLRPATIRLTVFRRNSSSAMRLSRTTNPPLSISWVGSPDVYFVKVALGGGFPQKTTNIFSFPLLNSWCSGTPIGRKMVSPALTFSSFILPSSVFHWATPVPLAM